VGSIARTYGHCVRHWTHDEATVELPEVRVKVRRIREMLEAARARQDRISGNGHGEGPSSNGHGSVGADAAASEIAALIGELQADGIIVRDPERGLIDFPALAPSGETYLLCWLDGEDAIDWWHWPDAGFAGRTPITSPPE
jgi:hypothetical protein